MLPTCDSWRALRGVMLRLGLAQFFSAGAEMQLSTVASFAVILREPPSSLVHGILLQIDALPGPNDTCTALGHGTVWKPPQLRHRVAPNWGHCEGSSLVRSLWFMPI